MKKISILFSLLFGVFITSAQTETLNYAGEIAAHRAEYKQHFLANERSPLKAEDLPDLRFYEPDIRYRFDCAFERTPDEKPFDLPTYSGITKPFVKYGVLSFQWEGTTYRLAVYQNLLLKNVPHLFLPFKDASNGEASYGGGRYIDLKIEDIEQGWLTLDFNKCYNPWCCYSDGYNCPIPPTENHLDIAIEAGEKMFAGEKKHK
jgi:hypothetical protein